MSEKGTGDIHEWVKGNVPIVVALLFTCVVVAIISTLAHRVVPIDPTGKLDSGIEISRWDWFFRLSPNEMGDTLAGLLGALTLVWIIASVFHQSKELADQRAIMREQKKEFELMVQAQNAQVEALRSQTALLDEERKERIERSKSEELDQLLIALCNICDLASIYTYYDFLREADDFGGLIDHDGNFHPEQDTYRFHLFKVDGANTLDARVFLFAKNVLSFQIFLESEDRYKTIAQRKTKEFIEEVVLKLKTIEEFRNGSGRIVNLRVNSAFIQQMRESLEKILSFDMWAAPDEGRALEDGE